MAKHKVFESYYHKDDDKYRTAFESKFGDLFIVKSVQKGDIDSDNSDEYIKALIQKDFIGDASVVVVLVGPKTRCRKHVDWEISAGLDKKVNGYSGLIGILLPEFPLDSKGNYKYADVPDRLAKNVESDYAKMYRWDWITEYSSRLTTAVEEAFDRRESAKDKIVNRSLSQMTRDTCD